jgi:hypothetical protein
MAHSTFVNFSGVALHRQCLHVIRSSSRRSDRVWAAVTRGAMDALMPFGFFVQKSDLLKLEARALMTISATRFVNPRTPRRRANSFHIAVTIFASDSFAEMNIALTLRANARMAGVTGIAKIGLPHTRRMGCVHSL